MRKGGRITRNSEVRKAVKNAKQLLQNHGYDCQVTAEDLVQWFEADTPYNQGTGLDEVIRNPLFVAHELVEIDNVKEMGLALTKDVIVKNMKKVDDAHLKAAQIEIQLAISMNKTQHIKDRIKDIQSWIKDSSVVEENKKEYRELKAKALRALAEMSKV